MFLMKHDLTYSIPGEVAWVTETLEKGGFEAYLVGGCVRDLVRGVAPKDWDVATNAIPADILSLFPHAHYDNEYGTVRVVNDETEDPTLKVVEVTTYRLEAEYSDGRRPDNVSFSTNLHDDLQRRDFTMNALAAKVSHETQKSVIHETIVDLYGGLDDLKDKTIKTVGNPDERFNEDALRLMRAVRFSAELGFMINSETEKALLNSSHKIKNIALERVGEEFRRIIMSPEPQRGLETLRKTGILEHIIPELLEGIGIDQNQAHSYTVWEHLMRSLQAAADKNWSLELRLAALFHDISKPYTRRKSAEKGDWTFHGHEVVGSRVTKNVLERLKYPKKTIETVTKLVRWHMFFSDPDQITLSAVRRMIRNVGEELIWDLMNLRIADRVGTGRPKEQPYRFRKYKSMIEEALRDPVTVGMLKIDGERIMEITQSHPGPHIGYILHALLEEVLDDPSKNTPEYLEGQTQELYKLDIAELKIRGESGKGARDALEEKEIKKLRSKHHVN